MQEILEMQKNTRNARKCNKMQGNTRKARNVNSEMRTRGEKFEEREISCFELMSCYLLFLDAAPSFGPSPLSETVITLSDSHTS